MHATSDVTTGAKIRLTVYTPTRILTRNVRLLPFFEAKISFENVPVAIHARLRDCFGNDQLVCLIIEAQNIPTRIRARIRVGMFCASIKLSIS